MLNYDSLFSITDTTRYMEPVVHDSKLMLDDLIDVRLDLPSRRMVVEAPPAEPTPLDA